MLFSGGIREDTERNPRLSPSRCIEANDKLHLHEERGLGSREGLYNVWVQFSKQATSPMQGV